MPGLQRSKSRGGHALVSATSQSRPVQPQPTIQQSSARSSQVQSQRELAGPWYEESTKFVKVLSECGIRLTNTPQQPSELSQTPTEIFKALTNICESSDDKQTFLELFISGFEKYIRTPLRLQMAVMPTTFSIEAGEKDSQLVGPSESVLRLLLKVDVFQSKIAESVLKKLASLLGTGNPSTSTLADLPKIVVDQFRFLDSVKNGEEMCNHFLDIMPLCDQSMKTDILSCLPQLIIDGQEAENVGARLRELLETENDLLGPILEAIGNLPLSAETLLLLRETVLQKFVDYIPDDKVATMKFLLQTADAAGDVDQLISQIRDFDFVKFFDDAKKRDLSSQKKNFGKGIRSSMGVAIAKDLEAVLMRSKVLADSALRMESSPHQAGDRDKFLDVLIAFILIECKRARPVFTVVRQKVKTNCWDEPLIDTAFRFPEIMEFYFQSIMTLADYLIRLSEKKLSKFGAYLYERAFLALDKTRKQDIITALVTHVNSGNEELATLALETLDHLCSEKEIIEFEVTLQGLLDMLPGLKLHQIRKIFALFGRLASFADDGAIASLDDLHIFVRKNINCGVVRQKAIGMLAALTLYRYVAAQEGMQDQAVALYNIAANGCRENDALRSLFYDELSAAISNGSVKDEKLVNDVKEELFRILEKGFIEEGMDRRLWKRLAMDGALVGASSDTEPSLSLKILQAGQDGRSSRNSDESAVILPSVLRLFLTCQWQLNGNFDDVDLLLGCPLILRKRDNWSRIREVLPVEQQLTCLELLQCGNCLVELINGLARITPNQSTNSAINRRLNDLVSCQREFQNCVNMVESFSMPTSETALDTSPPKLTRKVSSKPTVTKKRKVTKTVSKKQKAVTTTQTTCTDLISQVASSTTTAQQSFTAGNDEGAGPSRKPGTGKMYTHATGKYFRKLDAPVFSILQLPSVFSEPAETDTPSLSLPTLGFLLTNLVDKHRDLLESGSNRTLAMKKSEKSVKSALDSTALDSLKQRFLEIMPHVWKHLMECLGYFKEKADENDGIVDSLATRGTESLIVGTCVDLSLKCISDYLAWLDSGEALSVLRKVLASFAGGETNEDSDLGALVSATVDNLLQYAEYVPTLALAAALLRGANVVIGLGPANEKRSEIADIADGYLKREWSSEDIETSNSSNSAVASILELSLFAATPSERLIKVERRIDVVTIFSKPDGADEVPYKCLTKHTLYVWYRTLFTTLATVAKESPRAEDGAEAWLTHWVQVARCLRLIVRIVQISSSRQMLAAALRQSLPVFQTLMTKAIPVLEKKLKDIYPKNIQQFFTVIQHAARMLHDIVVHAKINTDPILMKFVPPLKRVLEAFIYRVKAMLAINNCISAMSIGILKNKNLDGESVASQRMPSQRTVASEESMEEPEEEPHDEGDKDQEEEETGFVPQSDDEETNDDDDDDDEIDNDDQSESGSGITDSVDDENRSETY